MKQIINANLFKSYIEKYRLDTYLNDDLLGYVS
mgnify:CR=1 FL=1